VRRGRSTTCHYLAGAYDRKHLLECSARERVYLVAEIFKCGQLAVGTRLALKSDAQVGHLNGQHGLIDIVQPHRRAKTLTAHGLEEKFLDGVRHRAFVGLTDLAKIDLPHRNYLGRRAT